jgi:hypothetical protein
MQMGVWKIVTKSLDVMNAVPVLSIFTFPTTAVSPSEQKGRPAPRERMSVCMAYAGLLSGRTVKCRSIQVAGIVAFSSVAPRLRRNHSCWIGCLIKKARVEEPLPLVRQVYFVKVE